MSRLKKRSGAGAGAVSTGMVATREDGVGDDAPPSAAKAITGDTRVRRTKNRNACHICLRPLSFALARQARLEHVGNLAESHRMVEPSWCQSRASKVNLVALIVRAPESVSDHLAWRNQMTAVLFFLALTRLAIGQW